MTATQTLKSAARKAALGCGILLLAAPAGRAAPPYPTFSHPTAISNLYLPLASLHQDVLAGRDKSVLSRTERTVLPATRTFHLNGQTVTAMIVEDRDYEKGMLAEATQDYYAQGDDGAVYYLGEKVDEYKRGKIVGHGGAWLAGEHGARPGIQMTAHPKVGDRWQSEAVPGVAEETDVVVDTDATVTGPTGTYRHCIKVKEMVPGEGAEYKYYAPHVGVVEEVPVGGVMRLQSHTKQSK